MAKIKNIEAREIKDSRGDRTIEVELKTGRGSFAASCPSGKSMGKNEAAALSVPRAIENVNKIIAVKLKGWAVTEQKAIDDLMVKLDGTENKSRLGANAILPVSTAVCRAGAETKKIPLYRYIMEIGNWKMKNSNLRMPLPAFNFIEGGAHADNDLDIQEFMIMTEKKSFKENLILANKIFGNLKDILAKNYGPDLKTGDEGGFAPPISKTEQVFFLLKNAAGNEEIKIIIDAAASQFFNNGKYFLEGKELSRSELLDFYRDLAQRFPIVAIEDPFSEEDWLGFQEMRKEMSNTIVIGDDLTTTNIKRIKEAQSKKACNGIIIKPNQIGTVTETIEAAKLAKSYGWKIIVSHRSGETMDNFIADLAVGVGTDFIKSGSPTQPERMVKYKRLLEIENELIR